MPDTPFSTPTEVRRAPATEAAQACEVVRQSITHCCALDHQHNPAVLAAWLANKTADHLAAWMAAPHAMAWGAYRGGERGSDRSAEQASTMVGFALLMQDKLALCYVVPQALHQGVGRALLLAAKGRAAGGHRCVGAGEHADGRCFLPAPRIRACRRCTGLGGAAGAAHVQAALTRPRNAAMRAVRALPACLPAWLSACTQGAFQ